MEFSKYIIFIDLIHPLFWNETTFWGQHTNAFTDVPSAHAHIRHLVYVCSLCLSSANCFTLTLLPPQTITTRGRKTVGSRPKKRWSNNTDHLFISPISREKQCAGSCTPHKAHDCEIRAGFGTKITRVYHEVTARIQLKHLQHEDLLIKRN